MEHSIIVAGFGGQGVLFAGQLLAHTAMETGRHVTWIPSYGPEMRGGTAHCTVIISDDPIGAPIVSHPSIAIALNQLSFLKYEPLVKPGGLLVVNSSIVTSRSERDDIELVYVPANEIAETVGTIQMLNMAAVGAMLARRPFFTKDAVEETLASHLPADKGQLLESNYLVLRQGYEASLTAEPTYK